MASLAQSEWSDHTTVGDRCDSPAVGGRVSKAPQLFIFGFRPSTQNKWMNL